MNHKRFTVLMFLTAIGCGCASWLSRSFLFWDDAFLAIAGSFISLGLAVVVYDTYQRARQRKVWGPLQRQVLRNLSQQVCLLVDQFHVLLGPYGWNNLGGRISLCSGPPGPEGLAHLTKMVSECKDTLSRFEGEIYQTVVIPEGASEDERLGSVDGERLVTFCSQQLSDQVLDDLRGRLVVLAPVAEDISGIVIKLEDFITLARKVPKSGIAQRMGEPFSDFFRDLPEMLDKTVDLYKVIQQGYDDIGPT